MAENSTRRVVATTFTKMHGPHPRLYSELMDYKPDSGLHYTWEKIVATAEENILNDILISLRQGKELRNILLISTICFGFDAMNTPVGKRGLKRSTKRFIYHALATIDTACLIEEVPEKQSGYLNLRNYHTLMEGIQSGFKWLNPPSKSRPITPLTKDETILAEAFCIVRGTGRYGERERVIYFIADNYQEMKPYFSYIWASDEISLGMVQSLLATKPVIALAAGSL